MPESMLRHFRWVRSRTHVTWLAGLSKRFLEVEYGVYYLFSQWAMSRYLLVPTRPCCFALLFFGMYAMRLYACVTMNPVENGWQMSVETLEIVRGSKDLLLYWSKWNVHEFQSCAQFPLVDKSIPFSNYSGIIILAGNIPIYRVLYMQDVPQPQSLNLKHESDVQIPNGLVMSKSAC